MFSLTDYKHAIDAKNTIILFKKIYPDCNDSQLSRIAYDENHVLHYRTKLLYLDNQLIGQVNVFRICLQSDWLNIGYHLDPNFHRKGIGHKMVLESICDIKSVMVIQTSTVNIASCRTALSLGFAQILPESIPNVLVPYMKFMNIDNGVCYKK